MAKKILGGIAALLFVVGTLLFAAPDIVWRRVINARNHVDGRTRRRTETQWQRTWALWHRRMTKLVMGSCMSLWKRDHLTYNDKYILIMNHRTTLDNLEAQRVAEELGVEDLRWVVKEAMRFAPVLGRSLERSDSAFVSRNGDPKDKERIAHTARQARADGASVAIYVEGTRFNGVPKPGSKFTRLREPRAGGLEVLCRELPEYKILVACLDWGDLQDARTMWDGSAFVGRHGRVIIWEEDNPGPEGVRDLLDEVWEQMEQILTRNAAHLTILDRHRHVVD